MTACPWLQALGPSPFAGPESLPEAASVVVVGGGLAGVAAALFLAQAGERPVLLEARDDVGQGASGRAPGLLVAGLPEPPFRLLHALGEAGTRALYQFSAESRELLAEHTPIERTGALWVAVDDREASELEESRRALDRVGVPCEHLQRDAVRERLGVDLGPALLLPDDGQLDPARAVRDVAQKAAGHGARIVVAAPVGGVNQENAGIRLTVGERSILADAVVFAANPWLPSIHPFFEDKITPYREQALAAVVATPPAMPFRAQYGYFTGRALPSGALLLRGARWATPHMEVGEHEEVVVAKVQQRIEGFLARFGEAEVTHRWSFIEAMSCDGLPIVGPMPGAPRYTCCAGFNGNQHGLAVRAARAVVDGLLTGGSPGVPPFLSASRFL